MIIKKYLVKNMNEGLTRIRYELGKDAIIISQRKVRRPGIKGMFSKKVIEVTAAVENSSNENKGNAKQEKSYNNNDEEFQNSLESIKRLMQDEVLVAPKPVEVKESIKPAEGLADKILEHNSNVEKESIQNGREEYQANGRVGNYINKLDDTIEEKTAIKNTKEDIKNEEANIEAIHKEVSELKNLLNKVIKSSPSYEESSISFSKDRLHKLDIDEEFQDAIVNILEESSEEGIDETEALRDIFERDILISRKNLNGRVVLVGPTGVGKTTTIAKLAGRLSLIEKKRVGLITVDTYRIGAIEQLKTYAEIMNIPFKVVITMKEMEDAIEHMKDCDVVLIDTTGRSSKNAMQISELRAFVQKANPDHVNMVISATTKNSDIKGILKGYSELEYDNIIITKLDETTVYGSLYNIVKIANKPISFITTGQNVPDDIMVPEKEEIASFILGEEILC
ncbi:flagellar biosynthetic protein FlhF [Clostridium sp. DL-VIII]|uniref:flagellar biosynthesis protein FlhF n=1 Tax=Clostridium sp. DL-VIII TaxID=641107 RepID=UPI00023B05CE|nr:flagellar biosynthesis protein FlhF [Clostridium sp. DL-VIII]EHJ01468.1 flagellar biosynthetic protein FlhF [Clostridium sp. DL-VIII]